MNLQPKASAVQYIRETQKCSMQEAKRIATKNCIKSAIRKLGCSDDLKAVLLALANQ